MKKVFSTVDEKRGILQVTTDDERFYIREGKDKETGLPTHDYLPSATWICGYTPKGIGFYKWLAENGWDESQSIKMDRGKYGSRVHNAIDMLLNGEPVVHTDEFADPYAPEGKALESMHALTFEEYHAVWTFQQWWFEFCEGKEVEVIETEFSIWDYELGFAGTIDLLVKVDGEYWLMDWKTSKAVQNSHVAQVSAYREHMMKKLETEVLRLAIVQVGYPYNKRGYKFNEIEPKFHLFEAAKTFWADENDGTKPFQKDYPLQLSLVSTGVKKNMSKQTKAAKKPAAKKTAKKVAKKVAKKATKKSK